MAKSKNNSNSTNTATKAANSMNKKAKDSKKKGGIVNFFKGVKQELKKVVWPTRSELGTDTVVVIATCGFFALFFWLIDTGFLALLQSVLGITLS